MVTLLYTSYYANDIFSKETILEGNFLVFFIGWGIQFFAKTIVFSLLTQIHENPPTSINELPAPLNVFKQLYFHEHVFFRYYLQFYKGTNAWKMTNSIPFILILFWLSFKGTIGVFHVTKTLSILCRHFVFATLCICNDIRQIAQPVTL